jgi:hypothetical protein
MVRNIFMGTFVTKVTTVSMCIMATFVTKVTAVSMCIMATFVTKVTAVSMCIMATFVTKVTTVSMFTMATLVLRVARLPMFALSAVLASEQVFYSDVQAEYGEAQWTEATHVALCLHRNASRAAKEELKNAERLASACTEFVSLSFSGNDRQNFTNEHAAIMAVDLQASVSIRHDSTRCSVKTNGQIVWAY